MQPFEDIIQIWETLWKSFNSFQICPHLEKLDFCFQKYQIFLHLKQGPYHAVVSEANLG